MRVLLVLIILVVAALPVSAQQQPPPPVTDSIGGVPFVVAPELYVQAGQAAEAGNYARALIDYSLFILLNPTDSRAFYSRGMLYQQVGELDDAINDLSQALALAPPVPEYTAQVYVNRAGVYLQQDEMSAALADLESSIALLPDDPDVLMVRASVYAFMRRFDEALDDYTRIITLQPNEPAAYTQRGELNLFMGNLNDALTDFTRVTTLTPDSSAAYVNRARVFNAGADYASALSDLDTALMLNPDNIGVYLFRAGVNALADNTGDAASDYLQWLDSIETRRIVPEIDRLPVNQPFALDFQPGWVYDLKFPAEAGQVMYVEAVQLEGGDVDPLLVVASADRQALFADDDGGDSFNALINGYTIPDDGDYLLIIGHAGGGGTGRVGVIIVMEEAAQ